MFELYPNVKREICLHLTDTLEQAYKRAYHDLRDTTWHGNQLFDLSRRSSLNSTYQTPSLSSNIWETLVSKFFT